jgi:hypothetical protein
LAKQIYFTNAFCFLATAFLKHIAQLPQKMQELTCLYFRAERHSRQVKPDPISQIEKTGIRFFYVKIHLFDKSSNVLITFLPLNEPNNYEPVGK